MRFNNMIIELKDIILFEDDCAVRHIEKRSYSALSFRLDSEKSVFRYKGKTIKANNGDISFVPQNVEYYRSAKKEKVIVFHFNVLSGVGDDITVISPENEKNTALCL